MERVGGLIRARRTELGLSLVRLAEVVGCAKSYLSEVETETRGVPGDEMLRKLEAALRLRAGELVSAAGWQRSMEAGGPRVREEVEKLQSDQAAARRLVELLRHGPGRGSRVDALYQSGELKRLVEQLGADADENVRVGKTGSLSNPPQPLPQGGTLQRVYLPREVPLINKVAAGYPTEFTDLAYPARVADEYVRCPDLEDPDAFAARVVGDSMVPAYVEGDIVIFSPSKVVKSGMDCFARLEPDHESTFKRVYLEQREGEEWIRLQPLNAAYPPRIVRREMVAGLYAAVTVMRKVG
jgi:SOS-response transcriptional repressor LexA